MLYYFIIIFVLLIDFFYSSMKKIGVYKITAPDGRVYVGASKNIMKRWEGHRCMYAKCQRKLMSSFKKYGVENHEFEILKECGLDELDAMELFYGLKYNVLDPKKGLNLALPKDKQGNGGFSVEANIKATSGSLKKGSIPWNKGLVGATKAWNKGLKWSEESKKKMSESSKGSIAWNRRLILNTEAGVFYNSSVEAAKYCRFSRQTINKMLDGVLPNKTHLQYV